jgi:hypothetical protein
VLVTAFSTNDDFAARFGEDLSDLEMTRVDALLARASDIIRERRRPDDFAGRRRRISRRHP